MCPAAAANMRSLYNSAMAVLHHRLLLLSTLTYITTTAFALLIFASAVSTSRHHHHHHRHRLGVGSSVRDVMMVMREKGMVVMEEEKWGSGWWSPSLEVLSRRRKLGGPGSAPPTCRSKCGRCTPCKPVHVPIQPGRSFPLEYYPEAWRCKCGNKLFMP